MRAAMARRHGRPARGLAPTPFAQPESAVARVDRGRLPTRVVRNPFTYRYGSLMGVVLIAIAALGVGDPAQRWLCGPPGR